MGKEIGIQLLPATNDLDISVQKDSTGKILSGLTLGKITPQNQYMILMLYPGELKEYPTVGVGITEAVNDTDPLPWRHSIREQLEADGQYVKDLEFNGMTNLIIDADYNG